MVRKTSNTVKSQINATAFIQNQNVQLTQVRKLNCIFATICTGLRNLIAPHPYTCVILSAILNQCSVWYGIRTTGLEVVASIGKKKRIDN